MFDLLEIFFGSIEGGGLAEGALDLIGGLVRLCVEGGAGDILGAGARAGGESVFARAAGLFSKTTDMMFDYVIWRDALGGQGGQAGWKNASAAQQEIARDVSKVIKSHSFILKQLEAHKDEQGVAPLLEEYKAQGMNLPSENLLKRARNKLSHFLHPDKGAVNGKLAGDLGEAHNYLSNEKMTTAYNEMLRKNPEGLKKAFDEIGTVDWRKAYQGVENSSRLKLGYDGHSPNKTLAGAQKWVAELSGAQKTGLVFGVVFGVALGAFGVAKVIDNRDKKKKAAKGAVQDDGSIQGVPYTQRVRSEERDTQTMTATGLR